MNEGDLLCGPDYILSRLRLRSFTIRHDNFDRFDDLNNWCWVDVVKEWATKQQGHIEPAFEYARNKKDTPRPGNENTSSGRESPMPYGVRLPKLHRLNEQSLKITATDTFKRHSRLSDEGRQASSVHFTSRLE